MAKDFSYVIRSFSGLSDNAENGLPEARQSPDMLNFRITEDRRLKKRPGFRTVASFDGEIRAIWSGQILGVKHYFVVESVRVWHSLTGFEAMEQIGTLPGHERVEPVEFDGKLVFLSGGGIRVFDGETGFQEVEPYRPLLTVATSPEGVGTPLEEVNLLGGRARQSFSPDGAAETFFLAFSPVDSVDYVKLGGSLLSEEDYAADPQQGCVSLSFSPAGGAPDSLEIGFTKREREKENRILRCRYGCAYGGDNDLSLFLWGNPDHPALRFHSGSAEGKPCLGYFPEINYTLVGNGAAVTDIVRHYDRQVIFTEEGAYSSYSLRLTDALGRVRVQYPVYPLSSAMGSVAPGSAVLLGNEPVTITGAGLCRWRSTNVREEKNAVLFSQPIASGLRKTDLKKAFLFFRSFEGCLYLVTEERDVYVYSPRLDAFWLYRGWEPSCFFEEAEGGFYFGTDDGRLCLVEGHSDDGEEIEAYWSTTELDLGNGSYTKTLHRIGVRLTGGVENGLVLSWTADVEGNSLPNGKSRILQSKHRLFSFEEMGFEDFSFNTAFSSRLLSLRPEARRFGRIRLRLYSKGSREVQIEELSLRGTVNDKKL